MPHIFDQLKARYRYSTILLKQLVITDFKLRYQGSILGYMWSLLRPLSIFLILYLVFVRFLPLGRDIPHFPVYLLLGIVLWTYFADVTNGGVGSIVARSDILRKLNFPKYVIVLAGSFSALINLAINLVVVMCFVLLNGVELHSHAFLALLLVGELFVLSLALAFFLSALFVRLRDLNHVWDVLMQGLFYATPIIYSMSLLSVSAAKVLILSPVAQIIQDVRYLLITPETMTISSLYGNAWMRLVPVAMTIILAALAVWYFKKASPHFAEVV